VPFFNRLSFLRCHASPPLSSSIPVVCDLSGHLGFRYQADRNCVGHYWLFKSKMGICMRHCLLQVNKTSRSSDHLTTWEIGMWCFHLVATQKRFSCDSKPHLGHSKQMWAGLVDQEPLVFFCFDFLIFFL